MAILNGINIKGTEEVHQLDYEKAIAHKPFYSEQGEVDILPKADYPFENAMYVQMQAFGLVEGNTYKVEFDGTLYECECIAFVNPDGLTVYFIGNDTEIGGSNNDIPFTVADSSDNMAMIMVATEGTSHNIRIYQDGEIVHQLDPKYVDGYTKAQIKEMFNSLVNGDEVAY